MTVEARCSASATPVDLTLPQLKLTETQTDRMEHHLNISE